MDIYYFLLLFLQYFISEEILKNQAEGCLKINGTQKVKMPYKNKNIFFMNCHKQLIAPFVIYADFECITVPIKEEHGKQTVAYQEHKACGYHYKIVCQYDDKYSIPYKGYRGENKNQKWDPLRAMKTFIRRKMGHTT